MLSAMQETSRMLRYRIELQGGRSHLHSLGRIVQGMSLQLEIVNRRFEGEKTRYINRIGDTVRENRKRSMSRS